MRETVEHEWGTMVWHESAPGDERSSAEMTLRAGCTSPAHRHPNCEERLHVREGAVTVVVDGRAREVRAGDSVRVGRGAAHHVVAAPDEEATLVLEWSAARREYEEL